MTRRTALRGILAFVIFVMGSLQAWDSNVPEAGLMIVFLVSVAIALPAVALLVPLRQAQFIGAFGLSLVLLLIARLLSRVALPGLFLVLIPAVMGLVYVGIFEQHVPQKG